MARASRQLPAAPRPAGIPRPWERTRVVLPLSPSLRVGLKLRVGPLLGRLRAPHSASGVGHFAWSLRRKDGWVVTLATIRLGGLGRWGDLGGRDALDGDGTGDADATLVDHSDMVSAIALGLKVLAAALQLIVD